MKTICSKGFKISAEDQKALDDYLLITPRKWARDALDGMINRAIKTIIRDWFVKYKAQKTGSVNSDPAFLIAEITAMSNFRPYNIQTPNMPTIDRKRPKNQEIWEGGFTIQDFEEIALKAYYNDPEGYLDYLMENKISRRRECFVKEREAEMMRNKEPIPVSEDDFINYITSKADYKNRMQRENEQIG